MKLSFQFVFILISYLSLDTICFSQTLKKDYLTYIQQAAELGWQEYPGVIENWKKTAIPNVLWGYDAPAQPIYLADVLGFLYRQTQQQHYAEKVKEILLTFGRLRDAYPKEYWKSRAEYHKGIPALSNFFFLPAYSRAYMHIRDSGVVDEQERASIERDLAHSLDFIFYFPEWGAMNRAMLRAEGLYYGAVALAHHSNARKWKQLSETLASDSLTQWEIEDASGYQPIWLLSLFSYAEISGRTDLFESPLIRYYMEYFLHLLAPHGNIADFGDTNWNAGWDRFIPIFEKAANVYRNAYYKYAAREMLVRAQTRLERDRRQRGQPVEMHGQKLLYAGTGFASSLTEAYRWADDTIIPEKPTLLSREVLEDVIGKKVVFRNGWDPTSTFLLLSYRDEGDGGLLQRDYLRQTISVEEEKMHHGHADENSICLLMSGGSVLLHDGGYRDGLPSGQWGAYRADYFHNRIVARKNKRDASQDLFEFMRNSGAYRKVETHKIDFLNFRDVDVSRTRLVDGDLGYEWDRVITYLKSADAFVVVDGIKVKRPDYYTFTNLWHTRKILAQGPQHFDTAIDAIGNETLPAERSLLVLFPESESKQIGTYSEKRHYQDEIAIYQTVSSQYGAGDLEFFVTVLAPHRHGDDLAKKIQAFRLVKGDRFPQGVGLEIASDAGKSFLLVKLDLEMDLARENIRPRYLYELGKLKWGNFETDASYLYATLSNQKLRFAAATLTKLAYQKQMLLEALPNTHPLQLDGAPPRTGFSKWRYWEDEVDIGAP
jgi:hypothetical protein